MKAGDDQADIFHPYTGWLQFYVDEGLVEEIDTSKLTNWDKVPDSFKKIGQINGKQYFLPWDWGFTSILYRTDKVPEGVNSWAALMDPEVQGPHLHVGRRPRRGHRVLVHPRLGRDRDHRRAARRAIKEEWIDQRKVNLFYWAGEPELWTAWQNGDVWVAYAWQGAYATLLGQGVPVAYANPKEGRNSWVGVYGIRKGTPELRPGAEIPRRETRRRHRQQRGQQFYYGHRQPGRDERRSPTRRSRGVLDRRPDDPRRRPTSPRTSPPSSATPGRRCGPK